MESHEKNHRARGHFVSSQTLVDHVTGRGGLLSHVEVFGSEDNFNSLSLSSG